MRTSNPAFNEKAFERFDVFESSNTMTVQGTAIKTIGLLLLTIIAAGFSWNLVAHGNPMVYAAVYGGAFGGLGLEGVHLGAQPRLHRSQIAGVRALTEES